MIRGLASGVAFSTPIYVLPAVGGLLAGVAGVLVGVVLLVLLLHTALIPRVAEEQDR